MQGGCISFQVLRQQLRQLDQRRRLQQQQQQLLQQQRGLGDLLPSEEHHLKIREDDAAFARQEIDSGDRLRFLEGGLLVESFQTEAAM
jgi:hypothetical protein